MQSLYPYGYTIFRQGHTPNRLEGMRSESTIPTQQVKFSFMKTTVCLAVSAAITVFSGAARADCTTAGTVTTCGTSAPNPYTSTVGTGAATTSGSSVIVDSNAGISVINANAISLGNNASITLLSGAVVQGNSTSLGGLYTGTGNNTIDFNDNSTLTIAEGAQVLATGTQRNAEAINVQGTGNTITNNGLIKATNAAAIWFQREPGSNTVINNATGVIETGVVNGNVIGSFRNSTLDFTNKGSVIGNLIFANGNDTLHLYTGSSVSGTIGGGPGNNLLTLNGAGVQTQTNTINNFQTLIKQDAGTWILDGTITSLTTATVNGGTLAIGDATHTSQTVSATFNVAAGGALGGYGQVNGIVNNNGTISVANGISAFASDANGNFTVNGTLNNAGLVQIGGVGVGNTLTVSGGGYVGQSGTIALNTQLGTDGSASDHLVVNGVAASGTSNIKITNVGGSGATTTSNGILVVNAINGGTTTASAFSLSSPISVGAYSYSLFRGGVTAGVSENWYLRSSLLSVSATGEVTAIPLYRAEAPIYAELPTVARKLGFDQLSTFHERQGEHSLLTESGIPTATWARTWGEKTSLQQDGTVKPEFDGSLTGLQVGRDIYANTTSTGIDNHIGIFAGFAHAQGNVKGFAQGIENMSVGKLTTDAYSVGGYWSRIGAAGWYTDAVVMGSYLSAGTHSSNSVNTNAHGAALLASMEVGLPVAINDTVTIEPQAQLMWQRVHISDFNDGTSSVSFNNADSVVARLGVRLQSKFKSSTAAWNPYLRANLLRTTTGNDETVFDKTSIISTNANATTGQIGAGIVGTLNKTSSVYAAATYAVNLSSNHSSTLGANIGVRWAW